MRLFILTRSLTITVYLTTLMLALPSIAEDTLEARIDRLMLTIENSGCQFIRNGKTYTPGESVAHIMKKYRYYRNDIDSIAKFIELSASKSLISGKPYYVLCDNSERQASANWLTVKASELGINR